MLLGFVVMMVLEAFANSQGHQCTKLGEGLGGNQRGKVGSSMTVMKQTKGVSGSAYPMPKTFLSFK